MNFKDIKYNNVDFSTMSLTIIQDFARVKLDKIMKYMCIRNFNVLYTHNESNYVYTGVQSIHETKSAPALSIECNTQHQFNQFIPIIIP